MKLSAIIAALQANPAAYIKPGNHFGNKAFWLVIPASGPSGLDARTAITSRQWDSGLRPHVMRVGGKDHYVLRDHPEAVATLESRRAEVAKQQAEIDAAQKEESDRIAAHANTLAGWLADNLTAAFSTGNLPRRGALAAWLARTIETSPF